MLQRVLTRAVDVLYPPRCVGCGRFDTVLCPECAAQLQPLGGPGHCRFCFATWDGGGNCPRCFHMHELEGVRAAFEMTGTARRLVHALKYRYYRAGAPAMAAFIVPLTSALAIDRYFAVPLHRSRTKSRGFNQAELLMAAAGWSSTPGLTRVRSTEQQVGLRLGERRSNVAGAFRYVGPRLEGLTVALLDDVVTTGATVAECATVLKDAGARSVWALAFARASYEPADDDPIED